MGFASQPAPRYAQHNGLLTSSKLVLIAALFFVIGGNVPLAGGFGLGQDSSSPLIRGAGLGFGTILLLFNLVQQRSGGIRRILFFLTPFLVFLAFCMISAAWSLDPSATVIRSSESIATVIFFALWTHAAVEASNSDKEVCALVALAILGVVAYGILVNAVFFGHPIYMPVNREESERQRLVFGGLHPLAVGDIIAIGIVASTMSYFRVLQKLAILLLLLPLLILTDATGARILVTIIVAIYVAVQLVSRIGAARLIVLSVLFGIVAGLTVAIMFSAEAPLVEARLADNRMMTLTGRTELWSVIWQSGLANTWFGTGFDAARGAIFDVFGVAYQVHNQYLSVLVELGYVGLMVFVAVFAIWLIPVVQSRNLIVWSFALYVIAINMNNASMFTKTWLIFATVFCYIMPIEAKIVQRTPLRHMAERRRRVPEVEALAHR